MSSKSSKPLKKEYKTDTVYGYLGLAITLFVTGGAIMMLELVGTRIIAPYYGTTLYVWSSMITVTLVFLSVGYFLGGIIADKKPRFDMLYILVFLAGLYVIFIPAIGSTILIVSNSFGPRLGPLTSSFILFGIPMALLGMVMPYAIKLKTDRLTTLGVTVGNLYAIATVGSFVGTILTGFILIPSWGIDRIIYLISFLLFGVASGWFIINKVHRGLIAVAIVFILFSALFTVPREVSGDSEILYKT